ncbi:MAG TPA: hypothetical protein VIS76_01015 [Pseudomonadales bacterium]
MKKLLTEPLTYFLLFGALLFSAEQLVGKWQKPRIVLDAVTIEDIVRQREDREMRVLDAAERQAVIDDWVADEILYREAFRRGLDRDDRIRRALVLKMRSEITGDLSPPSEETLRGWFDSNRERYLRADGQPAAFEDVGPYLRGDWLMEQSRRAIAAEVARLQENYDVVIEAG